MNQLDNFIDYYLREHQVTKITIICKDVQRNQDYIKDQIGKVIQFYQGKC